MNYKKTNAAPARIRIIKASKSRKFRDQDKKKISIIETEGEIGTLTEKERGIDKDRGKDRNRG
jgi:hypothetical protein